MRKHVALLLILFPVCGHLLDIKFYNDPYKYTWAEAEAFCRENHTDLVRVRTAEENKALQYSGWIGLSRKDATSPWKWSRGGEIAIFTPWDGAPKNDENCVNRKSDGKWESKKCDEKINFLCYEEELILVKENKTWEEALGHCRSLDGVVTEDPASSYWNHRHDLVTLITPNDYTTAQKTAQEATTDEVWTGLCNLAGEWLWVGGEEMQYEDIPKCPTEGLCGVLKKNGTAPYGIRNCRQKRNFICSKIN
ncbi:macrophage mannose receptor 1-like [Oreochromis niloticus]|uniref:Lymphocyte antigen 75-like n=1 Tax=Oreochromis niloticus TaxID=8128 RepID=A0A669EFS7_ORENI|nr:macrophage mannose receptor 1-like [Oreochromis niloticus]XP_025759243.1 macrophage mannose receptor 1-like [Oreochromis niloticus]XP_025759244.1 macrophage mannose receptor 1-like [Oreochromis niloticus]XP_025759245.1 macrophage mannose receptor 1-like [Oreochromis niloticus]